MTNEELMALADDFAVMAFTRTGEIMPTWIAETGDGQRGMILTPWSSDAEKDALVGIIRERFAADGVVRYALIVEAWVVEAKTPEAQAHARDAPPSEHPDRREVVNLIVGDNAGGHLFSTRYILRPEHGKPKLSPPKAHHFEHMTGRLFGLLRPASAN